MNVIAIRHVAFEDLGLLEPLLQHLGCEITYVDAWALDRQRAENADLAVFLGGPISVNDTGNYPFLSDEIAVAKTRVACAKPTLGICLGAQILACAIGGSVRPGSAKEIGWAPIDLTLSGQDSVLGPLGNVPVLHWHGEICQLPPETTSLAHTPACAAQAFIPGQNALALQFHIEAGADGIESWLVGHTEEIAQTPGITVARLRAETRQYGPTLKAAANDVFRRWFAEIGFVQ
jgi:GMP synthase (glutamine-hydrolysing)